MVASAAEFVSDRISAWGRIANPASRCQRMLLVALGMVLIAETVFAQQVPTDPTSTHIFPAGGRRGTTVEVRVGGECLPPGTRFRGFGQGLTVPAVLGEAATGQYAPSPRRKPGEQPMNYPREWHSQVQIAADAQLGVNIWRLSSARGGTGGRPFIVGDLPEFIESEPNSIPQQAERVELPVTINGQIAGESDLDYFRFAMAKGDLVRVDVAAARLGSTLDPLIQLLGPDGRRVAAEEVRMGADPILAFVAADSGEYRLLIANVTFKGGPSYVYRVTISQAPLIQSVFPPAGQVGSSRALSFLALSGTETPRTLTQEVPFPLSAGLFWLPGPLQSNEVPLLASVLPAGIETEGNQTKETATELVWPQMMNGQFDTASDQDWYRIVAKKGVPLTIECISFPRSSPTLPVLTVLNADGGVLAAASAIQSGRGSLRLEWQPPADGEYWFRLRDQQFGVRGGQEFVYCLSVQEAVPDFTLSLKSDVINVVQGGRTEVEIAIDRRGGCVAPIELSVTGLSEGIRIEGLQVAANQATTKLVLIADAEARSTDVTLTIQGRAEINGAMVERTAWATHLGHDADGVGVGPTEIEHVQLTVMHKPVFKLYCNEAYQYAHRGTIYPYLMEIERLDGFDGPIRLQVADRQIKDLDGIEIKETTVAPGQGRVMLPIYLPETMHINVQAHSNVYAQGAVEFQDKFGQQQTLLVVSTMRCMIRTLPPVAKLKTVERELVVAADGTARCRLAFDRTSQFSGPVELELVDAEPGIQAKPMTIPAEQSTVEMEIQFAPEARRSPEMRLKFRAQGAMPGEALMVSEASIPLRFDR